MRKLHEIEVPILNEEYVAYIIYGNPKKAQEYVNDYFSEDFDDSEFTKTRGRCFAEKGKHPVIWLNIPGIIEDYPKHIYATVAHEAVHAVDSIFNKIGEQTSNEIFAHSVGAIVFAFERYYK